MKRIRLRLLLWSSAIPSDMPPFFEIGMYVIAFCIIQLMQPPTAPLGTQFRVVYLYNDMLLFVYTQPLQSA